MNFYDNINFFDFLLNVLLTFNLKYFCTKIKKENLLLSVHCNLCFLKQCINL
jgi:hypothetical protein